MPSGEFLYFSMESYLFVECGITLFVVRSSRTGRFGRDASFAISSSACMFASRVRVLAELSSKANRPGAQKAVDFGSSLVVCPSTSWGRAVDRRPGKNYHALVAMIDTLSEFDAKRNWHVA